MANASFRQKQRRCPLSAIPIPSDELARKRAKGQESFSWERFPARAPCHGRKFVDSFRDRFL